MKRLVGTISRGIRAPIIQKGDDIASIVVDSVLAAAKSEGFELRDRDVVGITEAIVARAQGNYATVDQIAEDISGKFGKDSAIGVVFPILSRNRFSVCLKGIARGVKKIILILSYPSDEVGNQLVDIETIDAKGVNPWSDSIEENEFRNLFGEIKHSFTGVDYLDYYREIIQEENCEAQIILSNSPETILKFTDKVLYCDIHSRHRTKRILQASGAKVLYGLSEILSEPAPGRGYNELYGLLGSNKATDNSVKLFPVKVQELVEEIATRLYQITGKNIEVMVYGDGAFKDPVGKIWELADPVVSPAFTSGLQGKPKELKLKYLADNDFPDLRGEDLEKAISEQIRNKGDEDIDATGSLGTTPRQITDLLGSLCDLTSGSGDKGTPIVLVQGYFDNFSQN